jgi:uncharacterized delta-60 repeat protein
MVAIAAAFAVATLAAPPAGAAKHRSPSKPVAVATKPGTFDPTLAGKGLSTATVGSWVAANAAVVGRDGKIVTAAQAQVLGKQTMVSTRMLRDGRLDPSYGNGGVVTIDIRGASGGNALALQRDGKIIIAGTGKTIGGLAFAAVRLRRDGTLDSSFGQGGIATMNVGWEAIANSVVIRPDGRIVLGGTSNISRNEFTAVGLNADGSVDRSFGVGGVSRLSTAGAAWGMAMQPDGKLVLAGQSNAPFTRDLLGNLLGVLNKTQSFMVARLLPNGTPDPGFGQGGVLVIPVGQYSIGDAVALQPDGKIVLAGSALKGTIVSATIRLMPDGSFDRSFGSAGIATLPLLDGVNAVSLQRDGKIVLAAVGPTAIRLNSNGTPDKSFGSSGIASAQQLGPGGAANGVTIQRDNKIVLSGCATVAGHLVLSVIRLVG